MRRRQLLLAAGWAACVSPSAGQDRGSAALQNRRHRDRRWTCCHLDPSVFRMDLFWSGGAGVLRNFAELERHVAAKGRRVVVAMNGGMFEADGSPVGWCIAEGQEIRKANLKEGEGNFFLKPNGVFAVVEETALVMETSAAAGDPELRRARLITQSGPLLVAAGRIHSGFKADSVNRRIRNGVGVTVEGKVWWAISEEECSFHESATFFRDELGCPNALFLDGQVSRLHAPAQGRKAGPCLLGPLLAVTEPLHPGK